MAKVSYTDPNLAEIAGLYNNARVADRFTISRISKKRVFLSPEQIAKISDRSYLKEISTLWKSLNSTQQLAWKNIDQRTRKNGWQMFVKDCSARFKADIPGIATPSNLHQGIVGNINLESGAGEYMIGQAHPNTYFVQRRIPGKKSMQEQVEIKENLYLPLTVGLNYKSTLEPDGDDPQAKFGAIVSSHYQGLDIQTIIEINLNGLGTWGNESVNLASVKGVARSYILLFYFKNVKGNVFFDNVQAIHAGQNWARDPNCEQIEYNYSRTWQQVAKNWELLIDSPLAYHASGYLDE